MANVKFNRGLEATLLGLATEPVNDITVTKVADVGNYDSLYIGKQMIGTSLLRKMDPSSMPVPTFGESTTWTSTTPASGTSLVITADYASTTQGGTASPIMTARTLVDAAGVAASGYEATDSQILTAAAVEALVDAVSGDTFHTQGGFGGTYTKQNGADVASYTDAWYIYRALSTTAGTNDLVVTLPVETQASGGIVLHGTAPDQDYSDTLIPTSKAVTKFVEDYFAGVAGGMRYCGTLSSGTLPTDGQSGYMGPYKSGDTFKASTGFTITDGSTTKTVEAGDMIVLNSSFQSSDLTLSLTNCDIFEQNLTGAVTAANNFAQNTILYSDGTAKTAASASHITVSESSTTAELTIVHIPTGESNPVTVNVAQDIIDLQDGLEWHDLT